VLLFYRYAALTDCFVLIFYRYAALTVLCCYFTGTNNDCLIPTKYLHGAEYYFEPLTASQPFKKLPIFYETPMFIAVFTTVFSFPHPEPN
jgi:hypothetical protein